MKLSDQTVQITSSRNEILADLFQRYSPLMQPQKSKDKNLYTELSNDAAVAPLLPYFRHYLTRPYNLNEDENLLVNEFQEKISLIRALLNNPNIVLDSDLTQFIGLCLTALTIPFKDPLFEYTSLRENASHLIKDLIMKYSDSYPDLYPRTVDRLVELYIESRSYSTKLGAAVGISIVAPEFVKTVIIPKIPKILDAYNEHRSITDEQRIQFLKFKAVLMKICGDSFNKELLQSEPPGTLPEDSAEMYNSLIPYFGTDFLKYASVE